MNLLIIVLIVSVNTLESKIIGIRPPFGPLCGGTRVTLFGANLNQGWNRTIKLGGVVCNEIDNNGTHSICISGPHPSSIVNDYSIELHIELEKFNYNIILYSKHEANSSNEWFGYYEYKPNPIIVTNEPKYTIKSGKTNITFRGTHLNSVAFPKIVVTVKNVNRDNVRLISNCLTDNFGTIMTCLTPSLDDSIISPDFNIPYETSVTMFMDGINSTGISLIYNPDPIFYSFNESDNTRNVNINRRILKIYGKHLTLNYSILIIISNEFRCELLHIYSDAIICEIENNLQMILKLKYSVEIKVESLHFKPGYIEFSSKDLYAEPSQETDNYLKMFIIACITPIIIFSIFGLIYFKKICKMCLNDINNANISSNSEEIIVYIPQNTSHTSRDPNSSLPLKSSDETFIDRQFRIDYKILEFLKKSQLMIEIANIDLSQEIGVGQYGCVYCGFLYSKDKSNRIDVAIKTMKNTCEDIKQFVDEALIMSRFKHQNVLSLIGMCFEPNNKPLIILPLMKNGDLLSYIRDERNEPTVKDLMTFAIDIAKGMEYLSNHKYVHRDLAARNCMLDTNLCVKIADFGLSRDIYEKCYYSSDNTKCKLPVKWMSPESLTLGTYDMKSDVWSYGVVVWELLTRGVTPYPDIDNWDILNYLRTGRRLLQPTYCPELLYSLLLKCWSREPKFRPTFKQLVIVVEDVIRRLESGVKKQKISLDVTYINTYINYPLTNTNTIH